MATEVFIPKLGQTVEQVTLVNWLVPDGTKVAQGQEILEVETDKAVFPVEAEKKGFLHIGPYQQGDEVPVLTVVAIIGAEDEQFIDPGAGPAPAPAQAVEETPVETTGLPLRPRNGEVDQPREVFVSPRARKLAREKNVDVTRVSPTGGEGIRVVERDVIDYLARLPRATPLAQRVAAAEGVDLHAVSGTGPSGKITREDVTRSLQSAAPAPAVQAAPAAAPLPPAEVIERIPLKGVRAIIAERMAASVRTTARVTLMTEVDATEVVVMRERLKEKVSQEWGFTPGYNDILAVVVSRALRKFPYMNARLAADAIEIMGRVNLGMAVDSERGLVVPVIPDADRKNIREFGEIFRQMVDRARAGRFLPDDLAGGTFTITNLGMYDIEGFTPVINLPECAILGVGRIAPKPVARGREVVVRDMWTLSLVFDHRLVDGAPAARFLQYIKQLLEEPYLIWAG
ncbi:MAG TPA: 2-oxo acid dehydrogenase subunit E2 [Anaerolineaceae bacterium]|nr:2-oxo acid dehydrogenase subunit E2 [Anaerolineaceae bacterium]